MCLQAPSHPAKLPAFSGRHSTKGSCTSTSWQCPADQTLLEPVCKVWQQECLQTRKSIVWHSSRENVMLGWGQACNTCEQVSRFQSEKSWAGPSEAWLSWCLVTYIHLSSASGKDKEITNSQSKARRDRPGSYMDTVLMLPRDYETTTRTYHNTITRWLSFKNENSTW